MYLRSYRKENVSGTYQESDRMLRIAFLRLRFEIFKNTPFKSYTERTRSQHNKKVRELTEFRRMFLQ